MLELIRVAADLQRFCEARDWRFCFIGGLALQRWGEPRETIDVDVTLLTGFGGEEPFIAPLLTCSAEDLIVLKAFAARGRDWVDVEGIIVRQAGALDWRTSTSTWPARRVEGSPRDQVRLVVRKQADGARCPPQTAPNVL